MDRKGIARIEELRSLCLDAEVKFVACQMAVDLYVYGKQDFIPEIEEWVGAASFLPRALSADVTTRSFDQECGRQAPLLPNNPGRGIGIAWMNRCVRDPGIVAPRRGGSSVTHGKKGP
jgi:hypothetical protein